MIGCLGSLSLGSLRAHPQLMRLVSNARMEVGGGDRLMSLTWQFRLLSFALRGVS